MNILNRSIAVLLIAVLTLIGCGGGDGGGGSVSNVTGKFVDATVVGMGYKCGTSTTLGTTNAAGEFTCPTGQAVAFYVGDILIGSVSSAMAIVTPLDLVGVANGASPTQVTVTNIVRFLMSISSTNPTTGTLTIDPAVVAAAAGKTADFTANLPTALDTLINAIKPGATVYTNAQATAHVTASINGLFAGNYAGTYSGAVSGTWSVSVDANGAVTGSIDGAAGTVTGNMGTTLSTGSTYGFTGFGNGYAWTGTLNVSTKKFSGTWDDGAGTGTFTGTATTPPTVTAPTITSFTPTTGAVGAAVTITGTNLTSVTQVLFTGPSPSTLFEPGVIATKAATSITTTVPTILAAGSYTISVVHPGGEVSAAGALTVTAGSVATPTVTGYSPNTGAVGTTVTITGTNLGLGFPPAPIVKFGTTAVTTPLTFNGQTSVSFAVPAGLAVGAHTITIGGATGTPITVGTFTVTAAGGTGTGLTVSPAFNGLLTFADSVPIAQITPSIGAQFQYRQTSSNPVVAAEGAKDFLDVTYLTTATATTINIQLNVGIPIVIGGNPAVSFGMLQSGTCTLTGISTGAAPQCSGIAFDKVAGTLTLTNASLGVAHTLSGTLSFTPF